MVHLEDKNVLHLPKLWKLLKMTERKTEVEVDLEVNLERGIDLELGIEVEVETEVGIVAERGVEIEAGVDDDEKKKKKDDVITQDQDLDRKILLIDELVITNTINIRSIIKVIDMKITVLIEARPDLQRVEVDESEVTKEVMMNNY